MTSSAPASRQAPPRPSPRTGTAQPSTGTSQQGSALIIFRGYKSPGKPYGFTPLTSNLFLSFARRVNGDGYYQAGYLGDYNDAHFSLIENRRPAIGTYPNICQAIVPLGPDAPKADFKGQDASGAATGNTVWKSMPTLKSAIAQQRSYASVCLASEVV